MTTIDIVRSVLEAMEEAAGADQKQHDEQPTVDEAQPTVDEAQPTVDEALSSEVGSEIVHLTGLTDLASQFAAWSDKNPVNPSKGFLPFIRPIFLKKSDIPKIGVAIGLPNRNSWDLLGFLILPIVLAVGCLSFLTFAPQLYVLTASLGVLGVLVGYLGFKMLSIKGALNDRLVTITESIVGKGFYVAQWVDYHAPYSWGYWRGEFDVWFPSIGNTGTVTMVLDYERRRIVGFTAYGKPGSGEMWIAPIAKFMA